MSSSNPTRLRLRQPMKGRVDASGLVPELFSYPSQVQIARMPVAVGNDVAELGELFEIVLGDPKYLRIEGDCGTLIKWHVSCVMGSSKSMVLWGIN